MKNHEAAPRLSHESAEREANYLTDYLNDLYPEAEGKFEVEQYQAAYDTIMKSFYYTDAKVYVTRKCTGDCPFCLTEIRPTTREADNEEFLSEFKNLMDEYTENHGRKVLFTGGEPTSNPERLLGCLEVLKGYELDLVVLYTNGINLLEEIEFEGEKKTILEFLADKGLKHINLSVHDFDQEGRLNLSPKIGAIDTEKLIGKIEEVGIELRLNCTLLKDHVGDSDSVKGYVAWAENNGVKDIYFRDLFRFAKRDETTIRQTPKSLKTLAYNDAQRINFEGLIEDVKNDDEFDYQDQLSRHRDWGSTFIFKHKSPDGEKPETQISFGTLQIGGESAEEDTYFTVHPDAKHTKNMNVAENTIEEPEAE